MSDFFSFSCLKRSEQIATIKNTSFDLIIIGGGITGAGIALDAASRGMSVALFEKSDFASGTSSRSTKLIHGGLRYLKQLELGLVKEVGRERAIVHKNARHLVMPEKMLLPIRKKGSLGYWETSLALWVYDFLAEVSPSERRVMLDQGDTLKSEPLLAKDGLIGGGLYHEYRTDDARLTIEVVKKAVELGAICLNYSEIDGFLYDNGTIVGCRVTDHIHHKKYTVRGLKTVNAAGPWVDILRKKDRSLQGKRLQLTKGVHIVFSHQKIPVKQSVYFDTDDGRMIFAIPRNGKTYVGTTDTLFSEQIDNPSIHKEDIQYLIRALKKMFPEISVRINDIESYWSGLRPLIYKEGKTPSQLSRKDEIFYSQSGLISIAGGKLTGYRKMAERIVDIVLKQLSKEHGHTYVSCSTENTPLSGGNFTNKDSLSELIIALSQKAASIELSVNHIKEWVYRYGSNASLLVDIALSKFQEQDWPVDQRMVYSELYYCLHHESVLYPSDFLVRRTGMAFFEREKIEPDMISSFFQEQIPLVSRHQIEQDLQEVFKNTSVENIIE